MVAVEAQQLSLFKENRKWGYRVGQAVIITPEYDTAFSFDKTNRIALVANKSQFDKVVNPLTGEEESAFDYFYIDRHNTKLRLLAEHFPDSMFTFPDQQELRFDYQDSSNYFKILFQDKLFLFSKDGKQLSSGYDNIAETKVKGYFITENFSKMEKKMLRIKGLIDSTGLVIAKCKYAEVSINNEDSIAYCCSALVNTFLNDDVYNNKGKLIYSNKKHIVFSSKNIHVLKVYEPNDYFLIENALTHDSYEVDGSGFFYLKSNKALVVQKDTWYILDMLSRKKQKIDKDDYFRHLYQLIEP
ncbi:MAG: hypothetical protein HY062_05920 [Bacteroidetes bacterium]|nr:hypothetical protein [Bacteroidota bacterium]